MNQELFSEVVLNVTPTHFSGVLNGRLHAGRKLAAKLEAITNVPMVLWICANKDQRPIDHENWKRYKRKTFTEKVAAK